MQILFSIDDGDQRDLIVARLLEKYGFQGLFFIPNKSELTDEEIANLSKNHLIGGHTVNHPMDMKLLGNEELVYELKENKEWLEKVTEKKVEFFAYPRGRYNDRVKEAVKDLGYRKARTTKLTLRGEDDADHYAIDASCHIFNRDVYGGAEWPEACRASYKTAKELSDKRFHVWLHSKEIDENNWWDKLEEFIKFIHEDIHA